MNNLTSAFSIYEVLRIIVPGFYFSLMLGQVTYHISKILNFNPIQGTYQILIFVIVSIIIGALFYAMDIPRWFKKHYSTLPSNLIEKNRESLKIELDNSERPYEDLYYQFYYSQEAPKIFKTEIQSGFFHLLMTMTFIGCVTIIIHATSLAFSLNVKEYYFLNLFVTIISITGAIVIYKSKLRYSWKRNYDEFVEDYKKKNNFIQ